jgi:hypothetical protein
MKISMNNYSIESLLIGKAYRSKNHPEKYGIIYDAVKRDDVWVGTNANAYAICYRDPAGGFDKWATISVEFDN